jgi:hypothetical protein
LRRGVKLNTYVRCVRLAGDYERNEMFWFFLVIYGIAFGVLSAIAVKNKNRDQAGWFFIGVLFGIFGLIGALIVDKIDGPQSSDSPVGHFDPSSHTKKCPDCAEVVRLEAKVCRFCHHRFSDEEVASQMAAAEQEYKNFHEPPEQEEVTMGQKMDVDDLRRRFSSYSTEKLQRMRSKGRDSWREEALIAVDSILKDRGQL